MPDIFQSGQGRPLFTVELERWRKAFSEEAALAVGAMQSVVEDSSIARLASILTEWRDAGSAEVEQLREHVRELLRLNCSLRQCSMDQSNAEELAKLSSSIAGMSDSLDEIVAAQQRGCAVDLAAVAEQTAEKAVEAVSVEVTALASLWHRSCDDMQEKCQIEEQRWSKVLGQLERIQQRLERLETCSTAQGAMLRVDAQTTQHDVARQLETTVQKEMEDERSQFRREITCALRQELTDLVIDALPRFANVVGEHSQLHRSELAQQLEALIAEGRQRDATLVHALEELRVLAQRRLRDDVEEAETTADSYSQTLQQLHERLDRMDLEHQKELKSRREEAEKLREGSTKLRGELERSRADAKAHEANSERFERELREQRMQLKRVQADLEANPAVPVPELLKKLKELEGRRNIKIDLRSGSVEPVKPIEFEPRRSGDKPTSALADPSGAEKVLRDVVEAESLLKVPMVVEGYAKGGTTDFHVQLANSRALLIKEQLERLGVDGQLLSAKGSAGNKARPTVTLRMDVFAS